MSKAALFLDRDGCVNKEVGYIRELEKLELIPGAARVIRAMNEAQVPVILITNQSGPARGYYPESWITTLHDRLTTLLAEQGARLDAIYYCPHLPDGTVPELSYRCDCRKPEPGMLLKAADEHDLDLERSFMIGDKATDVDVGKRVRANTILLTSGYGSEVLAGNYQHQVEPDYIYDSLSEAFDGVLKAHFQIAD